MASADSFDGYLPDEQLFLLLQSMGYFPNITFLEYQLAHKQAERSDIQEGGRNG